MKRQLDALCLAGTLLILAGCVSASDPQADPVAASPPEAEAQLRRVVEQIAADIEAGDIEALQAAHLDSDKFTKFGPRTFERQDVKATNESEASFFSSISEVDYSVESLEIDVFGDVGIVTYYPRVSFVRDGEAHRVEGRQTLVFLSTDHGWKIVHEHGTVRH